MSIKDISLQLKYLKDKGYTESFLHLQMQSKTNLRDYPKEIQFFKKILLKGDFNQTVQFIWTFEQKIPNPTLKKLTLQIYKQKLYELLQNPQQTQLRNLFQKQIINVCSQQQYQHLFTLLTCRSVKQIPGMDNWSITKGRYLCFQQIYPFLQNFFNFTLYQKNNNKCPTFNIQDAIQSYISAQQKVQQRIQKSHNFNNKSNEIFGLRGLGQKQSKQSLQSKLGKFQNEEKFSKYENKPQQKLQNNDIGRSYLPKQSYIGSIQNFNVQKYQLSSNQLKKNITDDIEMAESKVEKPSIYPKYDKNPIIQQQKDDYNNNSTFVKKFNPYIEKINSNAVQKGKQQNKSTLVSKNYKYEDVEDQTKLALSYKDIKGKERQKEKLKQKQKEKEKEKEKEKDKNITYGSSYLKQLQKNQYDSETLQEEIKRNIAYLDQNNNSFVYKEQQNQNFTFSNGAEQQQFHDKSKKILKLTSFTDPKAMRTCQFSPNGTLFALGTNSSYLKIYPISQIFSTNIPKQILPICQIPQLHTKSIYCLDWSANQKGIATCSNDLTIKITQFVDNFTFANYKTNVIGRHESSVRMIKFNQLENKLVSCGDDSLLKVWDIGKIKKCTNLKGHTQSISAFKFAEQQDNIIYSVSKDCTVRKWDLRVAECVTVSQPNECQLTYIADNIDQIVISDKSGIVHFLTPQLQPYNSIKLHEQQIRSIDGCSYDDLLLTASFDGHICLFSQKNSESPNYHQHNQNIDDKVVFATFMNHPEYHGFASTSTMGVCNLYSFE